MEYAVHNGPKLKRANLRLTKLNPPGPLLQKNRVKFATSYMLQFSYTVRLFQIKAQFGETFFFYRARAVQVLTTVSTGMMFTVC